jgi:5-methylcytosine-specific restriction endonuclease McrA
MPYIDKECESCGALMEDVWHTTKACDECTTNECEHCGNEFEVQFSKRKERLYCSRKCATKSQQDKVKLICEHCGDQFERIPSSLIENTSYCSQECFGLASRKEVELKCNQCGDQFKVKPRQKDRSYCSRKCATKSQQDKIQLECKYCSGQFEVQSYRKGTASYCSEECHNEDQRDKVELTCEGCGEQFETIRSRVQQGRKYCSDECAGNAEVERVEIKCAQCGTQISVKPSRAERTTYCSRECKDESMHDITGPAHPRWKGGHEPYYGKNWEKMRKLVRIRDDHTCMRCGRHEKQLPRELDVHHIVPIREFDSPENANTMENLVALCQSCHGKVENTEGNGQNLLNHTTI